MKRGKREAKKERGRGRERREKEKAGAPSYEQSSRDTPQKERGDPEYCVQETQKAKKERRREGEGGGLSSRQVPMNLEPTSVAATTYGMPPPLTAAVT